MTSYDGTTTFTYKEDKAKEQIASKAEDKFFKSNPDYVAFLKNEDSDGAVKFLTKKIKANPNDYVATTELLYTYCNLYPVKIAKLDVIPDEEYVRLAKRSYDQNQNYHKLWTVLSSCGLLSFQDEKIAAEIAMELGSKEFIPRKAIAVADLIEGQTDEAMKHIEILRSLHDPVATSYVARIFYLAWTKESSGEKRKKYLDETLSTLKDLSKTTSISARRRALFISADMNVSLQKWNLLQKNMEDLTDLKALTLMDDAYYKSLLALHTGKFEECVKKADSALKLNGAKKAYVISNSLRCHAKLLHHEKVLQLYTGDYVHGVFIDYDSLSTAISAAKALQKEALLLNFLRKQFTSPDHMYALCHASLKLDPLENAINTCEKAYATEDVTSCDKANIALELAKAYGKTMGIWAKKEEFYYNAAFDNPCAADKASILDEMYVKLAKFKRKDLKERLEAMVKAYPDKVYPKTFYARYLIEFEGKLDDALSLVKSTSPDALSDDERYAYYGQLIDTYVAKKDRTAALKAADEFLAKNPSTDALYLKVHAYAFHDGYDKSAKDIINTIEKNKDIITVQGYGEELAILHANALRALKKPDAALEVLKTALPTSGDGVSAHNYWIARTYAEDKKDCASAKPYADIAWKKDYQKFGSWGWNAGSASTEISMICGF